jgi:hypothetical protein
VSPTHRPPLPPTKYSWYSFLLEAESTPRRSAFGRIRAIKNSNDISRIEPTTFRLVAQCLKPNAPLRVLGDIVFIFFWCNSPQWARTSTFTRFLDYTKLHTTVAKTSLDKGSARRRDLYLPTHNINRRATSMSPVGYEPTISAGKRPQTHTLDRAATGTGSDIILQVSK